MVKKINLPKILDPRGNLSFIERGDTLPFDIKRVYWIYDVPGGEVRHGHAFKQANELIVALSGSFDVVVTDADGVETPYHLARSYYGLLVPPMTWRRIDNFSTNSVAMILSSTPYMPDDYIESLDEYRTTPHVCSDTPAGNETADPASAVDSHRVSDILQCRVVDLPRHRHPNGSLTVIDNSAQTVPFDVRRTFYLYDVPGDSSRGGHSHHRAHELIVAASGSFDVTLSDGHDTVTFTLNRPYRGLYVPPGVWRTIDNFSSGAVTLVLTSLPYNEADYVRDYETFKLLTAVKSR